MIELETCKHCANRAISREEGLICGITLAKPDFGASCPDYKEDPLQKKRVDRHNKNFNEKEVHKESAHRALLTGIPLFGVGIFVMFLPIAIVNFIGLIMLIGGSVSIIYGITKYVMLNKHAAKTDTKRGIDDEDDLEVI